MPKVMPSVEKFVKMVNLYGGRCYTSMLSDLYLTPGTREFALEVIGQVVQCHICQKVFMRSAFATGEITCVDSKTACLHHAGVVRVLQEDWERAFNNDEWKRLAGVEKYLAKESQHESVLP